MLYIPYCKEGLKKNTEATDMKKELVSYQSSNSMPPECVTLVIPLPVLGHVTHRRGLYGEFTYTDVSVALTGL